ncbi:hypothetical protein KQI65_15930 [bacterium]|nr:hypothetical protein [bacterium]
MGSPESIEQYVNELKQRPFPADLDLAVKPFQLAMTPAGFGEFRAKFEKWDKKAEKHVYIHTYQDNAGGTRIIRVGSALKGIISRWFTSAGNHYNTYAWAVKESQAYTQKSADLYPHYLLFFAGLHEMETTVSVIPFDRESTKDYQVLFFESALIDKYNPVWESSFQQLKRKKNKESLLKKITGYGEALKFINEQRASPQFDDDQKLPDARDLLIKL